MFSFSSILYLVVFGIGFLGSIFSNPMFGLMSYLLVYSYNPMDKWWGIELSNIGFRHSLFAAVAFIGGTLLHSSKLQYKKLFNHQEIYLIGFIVIIWLSKLLGLVSYSDVTNAEKMTKVMVALLIATHLVTDLKKFKIWIWLLIVAGLLMGIDAYNAPYGAFRDGRLDRGVGGADFSESNMLSAFLASVLPFVGMEFLRGNWKQRLICFLAGSFIVNGIIMCRSRGAFLALAIALVAAFIYSFKENRKQLIVLSICALVGALFLVDTNYLNRINEISFDTSEMGDSSMGRILAWKAAMSMFFDHPLGIGEGNFTYYVGDYNENIVGKDTHNTYLRGLSELGIQGLALLSMLIVNAFYMLKKIATWAKSLPDPLLQQDYFWSIFALRVSLVIWVVSGLTMSLTYIEMFYWFLMAPVFLERCMENQMNNDLQQGRVVI